jgi:hypothetical protein
MRLFIQIIGALGLVALALLAVRDVPNLFSRLSKRQRILCLICLGILWLVAIIYGDRYFNPQPGPFDGGGGAADVF